MSYPPPPPPDMPPPVPIGHPAPPPYAYAYAPPPLPGPPPELVAPLGKRFLAKLVDTLLVAALAIAVIVPIGTYLDTEPEGAPLALAVVGMVLTILFALFFYDPLLTATGGTVGKRLFGLKVVRLETGGPVGFGAALGRHLLAWLVNNMLCVPLAYLWATWDKPHSQGLHDKIVRTVVIRTR
ncbi:RDD family protein [Streptomyces macrosporus]|uniref:RDD domain-containing protein n=1 Tax=Streptomyces macrosporus TaxID=44032 RepID=A0ABN3JJU3_9ACTN